MKLPSPAVMARASLVIPALLGGYLAVTMVSVNAGLGETGQAAISLALRGTIADPYLIPTGPTAHVSPLHVSLIAAIFAVSGGNTAAARAALSFVSLAIYLASAFAVFRFVAVTRRSGGAATIAVVLMCLAPFELFPATIAYRQWDQPFSALILMMSLLICADPAGHTRRRRFGPELKLAVLAGLAGLTSPSALPTTLLSIPYVCFLGAGDQGSFWRGWRPTVRAFTVVALILLPWGVRNSVELGRFILTRSNFNLELAVGNSDSATGSSITDTVIHPHDALPAATRAAEIGEVSYMDEMGVRAHAWIGEHPTRFAELTLRRIRLLLVPDGNAWGWDPILGRGAALLAVAFAIARLIAFGVATALRARPLLWLLHCLLPLAPYAITHVSPRYVFPTFFTSVCLVATSVDLLASRLCGRRLRRA